MAENDHALTSDPEGLSAGDPSAEGAEETAVAASGAAEAASSDEHAEPGPPAAKPRRRMPWKWLVGAAIVLVVLALVVPVWSTLQPGYYQRYPSLAGRMHNWSTSTHARVPCSGCHVNPGLGGYASFSARAIPAFYSQLLFGPKPTNLLQVPTTQACQKCHTTYRQVSPNGDLLIPHRAHVVVLKISCPVCHKNLVHSKNTKGFNAPEMQTCLKCHDGTKAKNSCTTCHTQKEVPASHKQKDWLEVHPTLVGKIDCGKCHGWTPNFCQDCHSKKPASHVGNWKTNHAAAAKARGEKGCLVCHGGAKFCKQCH